MRGLTNKAIETALVEMTDHVGYERHDPAARESGASPAADPARPRSWGGTPYVSSYDTLSLERSIAVAMSPEHVSQTLGKTRWTNEARSRVP